MLVVYIIELGLPPKTISELSDFIDDAILNWLSQKPMSRKELLAVSHAHPTHLRASLKRLLRAGKVRRFRKNRELIYSIAEGAREAEGF